MKTQSKIKASITAFFALSVIYSPLSFAGNIFEDANGRSLRDQFQAARHISSGTAKVQKYSCVIQSAAPGFLNSTPEGTRTEMEVFNVQKQNSFGTIEGVTAIYINHREHEFKNIKGDLQQNTDAISNGGLTYVLREKSDGLIAEVSFYPRTAVGSIILGQNPSLTNRSSVFSYQLVIGYMSCSAERGKLHKFVFGE